ncbi:hypothetical protein BJY01DRAFT_238323 [Aspergillus pseudoustus]|uniref:Zn(2)-C6 fungal-type domain-containing protein n=1 Tax=Aspergillus pseudoustus TaxID=1810923 RepID=A0ABR4J8C9_9EURO
MGSKPFKCRFPACKASYQRKEHRLPASLSDTLRRHMHNVHGVKEPTRTKFACKGCRDQKTQCEDGPPCSNCRCRGIQCSSRQAVEVQHGSHIAGATASLSLALCGSHAQSRNRRSEKEAHFIDLYFNEDQEQSRAIALHDVLRSAIHKQKGFWDASNSETACGACSWPMPTYQAILLHILFSVLYKGRAPVGQDLKAGLSPADADLFDRLVQSCKKLGILYYPNMLARIEEVKRFNIALYKICTACSEQECWTEGLNSTKAPRRRLRAADLQLPLPKNTRLWKAVDKAEWVFAATDDVYHHRLGDALEGEWISRVANVLEIEESLREV